MWTCNPLGLIFSAKGRRHLKLLGRGLILIRTLAVSIGLEIKLKAIAGAIAHKLRQLARGSVRLFLMRGL